MARPTNQQLRNKRVEEAENDIRDKLPELTKVLLDTALSAPLETTCPICRKHITVPRMGDPRIAITLLERVAGKSTEKRTETSTSAVERLLVELAAGGPSVSGKSPQQQAAEAIALAQTRAALAAAAL